MRGPFLCHGFLASQPAARRRELEGLRRLPCTLVFYEAPHRVRETVDDLAVILGDEREVVIARELTKLFESIYVCALADAGAWLDADRDRLRGEFVLVVEAARPVADAQAVEDERVLKALLAALPLKHAVMLAGEITGAKRNALYARALKLQALTAQAARHDE
jgi:16S rRNA (cytidine1402-2'-O)-methyltransferase